MSFEQNNSDKVGVGKEKEKLKPKPIRKIILRSILIIFLSLIILTLTFLTYFGLYFELNNIAKAAHTVTVSSEGPAAEMYPDSMGEYKVLRDVYPHDRYRVVYKHVDREDRFIIYTGNKQHKYF